MWIGTMCMVKKNQKENKNKQTKRKQKGKSCSIFLNQHNFICSKFNKLYNYNINILHNKTTGLWNNFNN
jgi:hypothetical protein